MLPVVWAGLAVVIVGAAMRSTRQAGARRVGRLAFGALYLGAGAFVNAMFVVRGDDYETFADGAAIDFVRDTWRSLVVPNHHVFIWLLIAFEAAVGVLALTGGRRTQLAYALAIAFHVALLSFGWGFALWVVPMVWALARLLRAERRAEAERAIAEARIQRAIPVRAA